MPNTRTQRIQRKLLHWYRKNQRDLPWRKTQDPYRIWVSEVMLQQTQVDRVIPKYRAWLKAFPTVQALAQAPLHRVLQQWSGLGYNRRGLNLREAARMIVDTHQGQFPNTVADLMLLPGIGEYTAKAIVAFAFKQPTGLIDTNVRRVIGRVQFGPGGALTQTQLQRAVDTVVPARAPATWHHAVMDLGATVCISRRPKCESCPLMKECKAYPKILTQKITPARRQPSFHDSDRFWRGRIIASLVEKPHQNLHQLAESVGVHGRLPKKRFLKVLNALERHGLVKKQGPRVRLVA